MFMAAPFAQGPDGEEHIKQMAARSPVRRLGVPEDIAAATAFLCSDDAGYHRPGHRRERRQLHLSGHRSAERDRWTTGQSKALNCTRCRARTADNQPVKQPSSRGVNNRRSVKVYIPGRIMLRPSVKVYIPGHRCVKVCIAPVRRKRLPAADASQRSRRISWRAVRLCYFTDRPVYRSP